jgi:hypothetical protein
MTTIVLVPENAPPAAPSFRAIAGDVQALGATAGQALDAVTAQLGEPGETTLVVMQPMRPDEWFTAEQRGRLAELMARWRAARDAGAPFAPEEQAELDALIRAELQAAALSGPGPAAGAMNPNYPAVARRAGHRREYCRSPEAAFKFAVEVEHVIPRNAEDRVSFDH